MEILFIIIYVIFNILRIFVYWGYFFRLYFVFLYVVVFEYVKIILEYIRVIVFNFIRVVWGSRESFGVVVYRIWMLWLVFLFSKYINLCKVYNFRF